MEQVNKTVLTRSVSKFPDLPILIVVTILVALAFDYTNGAHDSANSIASGGPDIPFTIVAATDVADAFIAAYEKNEADGEAFNISAGPAEPTRDFFSRFIKMVDSKSRISKIPHWIMPPLVWLAEKLDISLPMTDTPAELLPFSLTGGDYDISKANKILGYKPKKSALDALIETYRWVLDQKLF